MRRFFLELKKCKQIKLSKLNLIELTKNSTFDHNGKNIRVFFFFKLTKLIKESI